MQKLSKYYLLNILANFSLLANIFYIFYALILCINYKIFSHKNIYDYLNLFGSTSVYYFIVFFVIFILVFCFILELILRKFGKINKFNKIERNKLQIFLFWFSLILIPLSFLFLVSNLIYLAIITNID